jgi:hypothetical protein
MQNYNSQTSIDHTGFWPILVTICGGFFFLTLDFFVATSSVLLETSFLSGFGLMILEIGTVSALAGGVGVAIGELVLCNEKCTRSVIGFLRLGRWLPFFVVWAAPIWWIRWSKPLNLPLWTEPILQLVIAMFPAVVFTACYFYLSARFTFQLTQRAAAFAVWLPIVSDVLLLTFLLQVLLYANGWNWFVFFPPDWARPSAAVLVVGGFSFLLHRIGHCTLEKSTAINGVAIVHQFWETNWTSRFGAAILWVLSFGLWYRLFVPLRDIFTIAPLPEVVRAAHRLLTTGYVNADIKELLWLDVAVSSRELAEGLFLTGVAGIMAVKVVQFAADSTFRSSGFFAATHTVLVVLAILSIAWIGVGHWFRAGIVAAVSFLPFVQSLWGLRDQPPVRRFLLALDSALPYAFVGMLFAQLFASTAGLGFLVVVMRATGNRTEALATSLITFGLLVAVSLTLRLLAKMVTASSPPTISLV